MGWTYTDKTKQLFLDAVRGEPGTHLGEVPEADGAGEHGSIVCGDALRLTFRVEKKENPLDDVITEVRYLTFGCTSAIASSEALCRLLEEKRMTPVQALGIRNRDIVDYLGGLPQQKIHCSVMGAEALEAAVADWAKKRGVDLRAAGVRLTGQQADPDEGRIVCKCLGLTEPYLRRKIKELNLHTVDDVTSALKAGGMCGACRNAPGGIQDILASVWGTSCSSCASAETCPAAGGACGGEEKPEGEPETLSPYQLGRKVETAIAETIRPMLREDGGDIELVDIKGFLVYCSLKGACASCSGAAATLKRLVEATLKADVDERIRVIPV
jgi:NifU-like protein